METSNEMHLSNGFPGGDDISNRLISDESEKSNMLEIRRNKIAMLLALHVQNFQQSILTSRRRNQQRLRRRQHMLRVFYLQQMLELQTSYLEILSMSGLISQRRRERLRIKLEKQQKSSARNGPRFYEDAVPLFSDEQWLSNFRMTKRTFTWLCIQVQDAIKTSDEKLSPEDREELPLLHKRVALALYMLAHGDESQTIAQLFHVPRNAVGKHLKSFANALLTTAGHLLLTLPKNEEEYDDIRGGFQQISNMPPLVIGVLGVCELPVSGEDNSRILIESLIDDRLLFRKIQISSDAKPTLFAKAPNEVTALKQQRINDLELGCFVLAPGQCGYPLRPWLLHTYADPISPHEYDFNEAAENLHEISEKAVTRVFARWQFLRQQFDLTVDTIAKLVVTCYALHNLLEEFAEPFLDEWCGGVDMSKFLTQKLTIKRNLSKHSRDAAHIRDFLARTISSTELQ